MAKLFPLLFKDKEDNGSLKKPFGNILFGQERKLPTTASPEPNTREENSLAFSLDRHYHGQMGELSGWIEQLLSLKNRGEYPDVLEVPAQYTHAYRFTVMRDVHLKALLGVDEVPKFNKPNEVREHPKEEVYRPRGRRTHFSWTVRPKVLLSITEDWYEIPKHDGYDGRDFLVFLRAPVKGGNTFLMNPEETEEIADNYAFQEEVISVGEVRCDGIWYCEVLPGHKDTRAVANFLSQL